MTEVDILITNGRIYTAHKNNPSVEAVAVKEGTFREVGSARDIEKWIGKVEPVEWWASMSTPLNGRGRAPGRGFLNS